MRKPDMDVTPTLAETIRTVIEQRLAEVHVCLPAKIVEYDSTNQTATVQVQLKKKYEDGGMKEVPPIPNVPVKHPKTDKSFIHMPLKKDDDVTLVFSERSLDNWKTQGGMTDPADRRKFNYSDAIALIGGSAIPDAFTVNDPDSIEIVNDSGKMQIKPNGTIHLGDFSPSHKVGLADMIENRLSAIENKLTSHISTYNSFINTTYSLHMHPTAAPGPPSPPLVPGSPDTPFTADTSIIGSTKVKVVT